MASTEEMRAVAEQNFDDMIREKAEMENEEYRDSNNIPAPIVLGFDVPAAVAEELHADGVDEFVESGADYVEENNGSVEDALKAFVDDNFDLDYIFSMVENQYNQHEDEISSQAREMLRTDYIDQDEELSQLDDTVVATAIETSELSDVLDADYRGDAHSWADRYIPDWEDQIDQD